MFLQRFLTAIFLIPLVLLGIFYANNPLILGIIYAIVIALAWEWSALLPITTVQAKIFFIAATVLTVGLLNGLLLPALFINIALWLIIFWTVLTFPNTQAIWGHKWLMLGVAWFSLSLFAKCLWLLFQHEHGRWYLVYLLGLVWATDIGAYGFGKLWGVHRLIPSVSPGKTLEGTAGGVILASAVAALGAWYAQPSNLSVWFIKAWILIGLAVLGDLWISTLKRRVGIKDTGHILPGHGGILDRLDSLIATLPFFYFLMAIAS